MIRVNVEQLDTRSIGPQRGEGDVTEPDHLLNQGARAVVFADYMTSFVVEKVAVDAARRLLHSLAASVVQRYRELVARGIPTSQIDFLRWAVQRNQLTGTDGFILEIEKLTGTRILTRPPGRPAAGDDPRDAGK